jgi:hypothetical protein
VNTMDWTIHLEAAGDPVAELENYLEALDDLADLLSDYGASVSGSQDGTRVGITISLEHAGDALEAMIEGQRIFHQYVGKVDLPSWPITRIEVMTWDEHDRELEEPLVPELVGVAEIAQIIDVTRQRASKLAHQHGFPAPVAELKSGPVWTRTSLNRFVEEWARRPGRPSATLTVTHADGSIDDR